LFRFKLKIFSVFSVVNKNKFVIFRSCFFANLNCAGYEINNRLDITGIIRKIVKLNVFSQKFPQRYNRLDKINKKQKIKKITARGNLNDREQRIGQFLITSFLFINSRYAGGQIQTEYSYYF
jgi:hypothetical protein